MFSSLQRESTKRKLKNYSFDVVIIGGGITGAGIALDAVSRGLSCALVEMNDFASGTSSRSTKLVHGGLRYLKQFEVKMVSEVGKERAIVYENGPHITTPEWMLLPFHKGGTFGPVSTSFGLSVYDFLAGVKKDEQRRMLSKEETMKRVPNLKQEGLKGSGFYVEYKTDDARLTIEVLKKAVELGAVCLNYAKVEQFLYENEAVVGIQVSDQLEDNRWEIHGTTFINAAGPWVDELRLLDGSLSIKQLKLSKGVHLVFDQSTFPLKQAVYFDVPDGRMLFAIPRRDKTYVGTTDTFYDQHPIEPVATKEDVMYILQAIQFMFPKLNVTQEDVESTWAGVRPLIYEDGKNPSEISRKDEIWVSPSGLVTIAGGKLTGYRQMAETVVDKVFRLQGRRHIQCSTKEIPLSGGEIGSKQFESFVHYMSMQGKQVGLSTMESEQIAAHYGTNASIVFQFAHSAADNSYGLPKGLYAELLYAIHYEHIQKPVDFAIRRRAMLYFEIDDLKKYRDAICDCLAHKLSISPSLAARYKQQLQNEIDHATAFKKEVAHAKDV